MARPLPTKNDWLNALEAQWLDGRWCVNADKLEGLLALLADRNFGPRDMVSAMWKDALPWQGR